MPFSSEYRVFRILFFFFFRICVFFLLFDFYIVDNYGNKNLCNIS